jgi:hypothetical protein
MSAVQSIAGDIPDLEFARRQTDETAGRIQIGRGLRELGLRGDRESRAALLRTQFHPEVVHTPRGLEILRNFVHTICGCGRDWTMRNYLDQAVEEIREQVGTEE